MSETTTDSPRGRIEPDSPSDLSRLPSVERVMSADETAPLLEVYGRSCTLDAVRKELAHWREAMRASEAPRVAPDAARIASTAKKRLEQGAESRLKAVFNLTGTVLHTNLGRAMLPEAAARSVVEAMTCPVNLEFDLRTGRRGDRDEVVSELLCELTGAQDATVVNNNAAAVLLMLSALAARKNVVLSRGELIEIGGSFRIPDIMRSAGARLREVGTTNRTHLSDYEAAIDSLTALLMKVHCSN